MTIDRPRVLWVAGTRSEVLQLGPYALHFQSVDAPKDRVHWFCLTGEQGVAVYQALDDCGLRPDAEADLRHPAEDPTARLHGLIEEIENQARRHRATHLVFAGCGPTAAAASLVCHGRELQGVWIRPEDPAGLIARLRWERGLAGIIGALRACVRIPENPLVRMAEQPDPENPGNPESGEIEEPVGRRREYPLALIAVTRPGWGATDLPERLIQRLGHWAVSEPDADWLFLRTLDARFEGPMKAIASSSPNLLTAPPVPYSIYESWLRQARVILTDSWAIASEGMLLGIPVVALGEEADGSSPASESLLPISETDVEGERLVKFMQTALSDRAKRRNGAALWNFQGSLRDNLNATLDC